MARAQPQYEIDPSVWQEGDNLSWTSDPAKVQAGGYFEPEGPNLATAFDIDGLGPLLRMVCGKDLTYTFLLKDRFGNHYIADLDSGGGVHAYLGAHEKEEAEVVQNVLAGLHEPDMIHFLEEKFYEPRVRKLMSKKRAGGDDIGTEAPPTKRTGYDSLDSRASA